MKKMIYGFLFIIFGLFFVGCESSIRTDVGESFVPNQVIEQLNTDTIPNVVAYRYLYGDTYYEFNEEKKLVSIIEEKTSDGVIFVIIFIFSAILFFGLMKILE